jgi:photoactive yellow protein
MDPDDVMGRNFFTQVAPCTNNRLFRGRFKKGVRRGELDETFTYTYTYKMRPTLVDVHLYRDEAGNNWITVQKY